MIKAHLFYQFIHIKKLYSNIVTCTGVFKLKQKKTTLLIWANKNKKEVLIALNIKYNILINKVK